MNRVPQTYPPPPPLLACLQLKPLLQLQHDHISIYHELFIVWHSEVSQSRHLGSAGASSVAAGTRDLSTELPHTIVTPRVAMAVTPNVAIPDSTLSGATGGSLGIISWEPQWRRGDYPPLQKEKQAKRNWFLPVSYLVCGTAGSEAGWV